MATNMSKVCTGCGVRRPLVEYNKRKKASDGLRQTCRACDRTVRLNWEARDKAKRKARTLAKALSPGPVEGPEEAECEVVAPDRFAQPTGLPIGPGDKVIGHIGAVRPRIREVAVDPTEEAERAAAREYAELLNDKLPIRRRAAIIVAIAKQAKGPTAALALQALRDINIATGVVSKAGTQVDLGPMFVMPEGTSMAMKGGSK